jgi:hypothetical protein
MKTRFKLNLPQYWVSQNSGNNSMGQCQLMLGNYEKNNKKNLGPVYRKKIKYLIRIKF